MPRRTWRPWSGRWLLLERLPTAERIDVVFRAAHTLKGSSRAMGFSNLAELTHEMENVLDAVRSGGLAVTTEIADALLACVDALRTMCDGIASGRGDARAEDGLVARLQTFLSGPAPATAPVLALPPRRSRRRSPWRPVERPVFRATVVLTPDCVMKYVRAFMAIQAVGENGELLACVPDAQALEDEAFDREFTLFYQSADEPARVEKRLRAVGEVSGIEIVPHVPAVPKSERLRPPDLTPNDAPLEAAPKSGATVRVDVARLDELMNLVGELVIDRSRIAQIGAALAGKYTLDKNLEALARDHRPPRPHRRRSSGGPDEDANDAHRDRLQPLSAHGARPRPQAGQGRRA